MKQIDKETLIKQRFWILLGSIVPLVLLACLWMVTKVRSDNQAKARQIEKSKQDLDAHARVKETRLEYAALETQEEKFKEQKKKVWKAAWEIQKDLMTWPAGMGKDKVAKLNKLNFGDRLSTEEAEETRLRNQFILPSGYQELLDQTVKLVDPVQFNGGWQKVVRHVPRWDTAKFGGPPTVEEIWLALEDLWVQRELFLAIKQANDFTAKYKKVTDEKDPTPKPDPAKKEDYRERYRNPYWELDLVIAKDAENKNVLRGKIKNVGKQRQAIGRLTFRILLNDEENLRDDLSKYEEVTIQGESLAVNQVANLQMVDEKKGLRNEVVVKEFAPRGIFAVYEVFDIATSPIKRIDKIVLGQQSHRTQGPRLQPPRFSTVKLDDKKAPQPGELNTAAEEAANKEFAAISKTDNGVERFRYLVVTPQVRQIPVGIVLLVDQAHVQDVLTAMANSKRPGSILRIQPTQEDWHRYRGVFKTSTVEKTPPKDKAKDKGKAEAEEVAPSLVELAFYGIASLYERYRAPPKAPAEGDAVANEK